MEGTGSLDELCRIHSVSLTHAIYILSSKIKAAGHWAFLDGAQVTDVLTSLHLSFLICIMGIMIELVSLGCRESCLRK